MIINQTLQAGAEPMFSADGSFIFVDSADGLLEITTDTGRNYSLKKWDQVQLPQGEYFKGITIRNMHGSVNNVVIKTGYGKFFPANDGGSVAITDMPDMEIADGQSIAVNNLPNVQQVAQNGLFDVSINNLPVIQKVSQNGLFDVSINNLPTIQKVSQNGLFDVSINNLPEIQQVAQSGIWSAQQAGLWNVSIDNFPVIQKVDAVKSAIHAPLPKADFTSANHVIPENLTRRTLIIKASPTNNDVIWIGASADNGIPLFAGEKIELPTTAEINLFAVELTDNCYIAEIS